MSSKKTSSISFRINEEYEKILRDMAEQNKTSLNTLANQIFGNYVEFELYAKQFGTLRLSTDTFRRILDVIDEKNIIEVAYPMRKSRSKRVHFIQMENSKLKNGY